MNVTSVTVTPEAQKAYFAKHPNKKPAAPAASGSSSAMPEKTNTLKRGAEDAELDVAGPSKGKKVKA